MVWTYCFIINKQNLGPLRTMKSLTILLALVTMLKGCMALGSLLPQKVTVQVINSLSRPQALTLHCKSRNDDLGEHTLKPGKDFRFRFIPNFFFKTTLFFCNFRWPSNTLYHYFDIYVQERDEPFCKFCSWKIFEDRVCRYDEDSRAFKYCFPWNSIQPLTPLLVAPSATNSSLLWLHCNRRIWILCDSPKNYRVQSLN